jgi:hypothetical protein
MSARGRYLHERRLKAGESIDAYYHRLANDQPPQPGEIIGGLMLFAALALLLWLLLFAPENLREIQ